MGTMRALLALLAAVACAACSSMPDRQQERVAELRRQIEADRQDCDSLYPRGVAGPQSYTHRVRCLNEVETRFMRPLDPFPDLLDQKLAARKAIAADLDAGRISQADANARLAQKAAQIGAEERRRAGQTSGISADATAALEKQRAELGTTCATVDGAVDCF